MLENLSLHNANKKSTFYCSYIIIKLLQNSAQQFGLIGESESIFAKA